MPYDDSSPGLHRQVTSHLGKRASREESWTNTRAASKRTSTGSTRTSGRSPTSFASISSALMTRCSRATALALAGIAPKPFDHAVLAGILVTAQRLWESGERGLSFCEADADLQPCGDDMGTPNRSCAAAYDQAHIWVYGDFTLTQPVR